MSGRDPQFDAYVLKIYKVLDQLDYYRLLGVDRSAKIHEIKKAFFSIAGKFHPDRNRNADETVSLAIYNIFKRLNEAYRVLCDHERRMLYNEGLDGGSARLEHDGRRTMIPKTAEETMTSREARQFYRQAVEALKSGNLMQADLHIKVASNREGENKAIEELMDKINTALIEKKKNKK
jgi:curved DNA-binding protein CbpA